MTRISLESSTVTSTDVSWVGSGEEFSGRLFLGSRAEVPDEIFLGFQFYTSEYQLWEFDGTTATLAVDAASAGTPAFGSRPIEWITSFDNRIFFAASDGTASYSTQLWFWDGSEVALVQPTFPQNPSWLTAFEGRLYMNGKDDDNGYALWVFTPNGWSKPVSSKPKHGAIAGSTQENNNEDSTDETTTEWGGGGLNDEVDFNRDGGSFGEDEVQDLLSDILETYDAAHFVGTLSSILYLAGLMTVIFSYRQIV
mmetsp:Transcript_31422/g.92112  ORF Transcript_31422/g.92112 Transcript_31422/m.92112 type:complete len:253 (-) Transcript_31422:862-1620(-)